MSAATLAACLIWLSSSAPVAKPSPETHEERQSAATGTTTNFEAPPPARSAEADPLPNQSHLAPAPPVPEAPTVRIEKAEVQPAVAAELAAALQQATDRQWLIKLFAEQTGKPSSLSDFADFWIAVAPDLDRHVREGHIARDIRRRPPADDRGFVQPTNCCINRLDDDTLIVIVNSDAWSIEFTFAKGPNVPAPVLFSRLLERREASAPASK